MNLTMAISGQPSRAEPSDNPKASFRPLLQLMEFKMAKHTYTGWNMFKQKSRWNQTIRWSKLILWHFCYFSLQLGNDSSTPHVSFNTNRCSQKMCSVMMIVTFIIIMIVILLWLWLWWYYWWWWWLLPGSWGGKGGISRLAGHRPPAPRISPCWSSGWSWWSSRWTFHDDGDSQWQFVKFMMMIFLSALHSWLLDLPKHCEKHSLNHFKTSYWPRQELL